MPKHMTVDHVGDGLDFDTGTNTLYSNPRIDSRSVHFDFESTSPINVGAALSTGDVVIQVMVDIETAFDGSAPTLDIGTASDNDAILPTSELNLKSASTRLSHTFYKSQGTQQIEADLFTDSSTDGSGTIILLVVST